MLRDSWGDRGCKVDWLAFAWRLLAGCWRLNPIAPCIDEGILYSNNQWHFLFRQYYAELCSFSVKCDNGLRGL